MSSTPSDSAIPPEDMSRLSVVARDSSKAFRTYVHFLSRGLWASQAHELCRLRAAAGREMLTDDINTMLASCAFQKEASIIKYLVTKWKNAGQLSPVSIPERMANGGSVFTAATTLTAQSDGSSSVAEGGQSSSAMASIPPPVHVRAIARNKGGLLSDSELLSLAESALTYHDATHVIVGTISEERKKRERVDRSGDGGGGGSGGGHGNASSSSSSTSSSSSSAASPSSKRAKMEETGATAAAAVPESVASNAEFAEKDADNSAESAPSSAAAAAAVAADPSSAGTAFKRAYELLSEALANPEGRFSSGRLARAKTILHSMIHSLHLYPNARTYVLLLKLSLDAGDLAFAKKVYAAMLTPFKEEEEEEEEEGEAGEGGGAEKASSVPSTSTILPAAASSVASSSPPTHSAAALMDAFLNRNEPLDLPPLGLGVEDLHQIMQPQFLMELSKRGVFDADTLETILHAEPGTRKWCFLAAAAAASKGDQFGSKHGAALFRDPETAQSAASTGGPTLESGGKTSASESSVATPSSSSSSPSAVSSNSSSSSSSSSSATSSSPSLLAKAVSVGHNHRFGVPGNAHLRVMHAEVHALVQLPDGGASSAQGCEIIIVELDGNDVGYEEAVPCPSCSAALCRVGVSLASYTSHAGVETTFSSHKPNLPAPPYEMALQRVYPKGTSNPDDAMQQMMQLKTPLY